ncbi:hypothetical protein QOT17_009048 [Balamuthia mandrillaris]
MKAWPYSKKLTQTASLFILAFVGRSDWSDYLPIKLQFVNQGGLEVLGEAYHRFAAWGELPDTATFETVSKALRSVPWSTQSRQEVARIANERLVLGLAFHFSDHMPRLDYHTVWKDVTDSYLQLEQQLLDMVTASLQPAVDEEGEEENNHFYYEDGDKKKKLNKDNKEDQETGDAGKDEVRGPQRSKKRESRHAVNKIQMATVNNELSTAELMLQSMKRRMKEPQNGRDHSSTTEEEQQYRLSQMRERRRTLELRETALESRSGRKGGKQGEDMECKWVRQQEYQGYRPEQVELERLRLHFEQEDELRRKEQEMRRKQQLKGIKCVIHLYKVQAFNIASKDLGTKSDPYIKIQQWDWDETPKKHQKVLWKSCIQKNSQHPVWRYSRLAAQKYNQRRHKWKHGRDLITKLFQQPDHILHHTFEAELFTNLKISLYDHDTFSHDDFLGRVELNPACLYILHSMFKKHYLDQLEQQQTENPLSQGHDNQDHETEAVDKEHNKSVTSRSNTNPSTYSTTTKTLPVVPSSSSSSSSLSSSILLSTQSSSEDETNEHSELSGTPKGVVRRKRSLSFDPSSVTASSPTSSPSPPLSPLLQRQQQARPRTRSTVAIGTEDKEEHPHSQPALFFPHNVEGAQKSQTAYPSSPPFLQRSHSLTSFEASPRFQEPRHSTGNGMQQVQSDGGGSESSPETQRRRKQLKSSERTANWQCAQQKRLRKMGQRFKQGYLKVVLPLYPGEEMVGPLPRERYRQSITGSICIVAKVTIKHPAPLLQKS